MFPKPTHKNTRTFSFCPFFSPYPFWLQKQRGRLSFTVWQMLPGQCVICDLTSALGQQAAMSEQSPAHRRVLDWLDFHGSNSDLFPLPAGDASPSETPFQLKTADSSLLLEYFLFFYIRAFAIFEWFTFSTNISHTFVLYILPPQPSSSVAITFEKTMWQPLRTVKREFFY